MAPASLMRASCALLVGLTCGAAIAGDEREVHQTPERTCRGNLHTLASAESAYHLRYRRFTAQQKDLVAAPEGLSRELRCPLDQRPYVLRSGKSGQVLTLRCRSASRHARKEGRAQDFQLTLDARNIEAGPR